MRIKIFWIVTKPTRKSVLQDICFATDIIGIGLQYLGGLKPDEVLGMFTSEKEAEDMAKSELEKIK